MKKLLFLVIQLWIISIHSQTEAYSNQFVSPSAIENGELKTFLVSYFTVLEKGEFEKLDSFYCTKNEVIELFSDYQLSEEFAISKYNQFLQNRYPVKKISNFRKNRELLFDNWKPIIEFQQISMIDFGNSLKDPKNKFKKKHPTVVEFSFYLKNNGDQHQFINFAEVVKLASGWKIWSGPTFR